jgi:N-acetyl-gamma-glutamyl-phosphate reductase
MISKSSALLLIAIASSTSNISTVTAFVHPVISSSSSSSVFHQSHLDATKKKIFIDGESGTTGLQVRDRLADRTDLLIISIDDDKRKDSNERKRLINEADCVILCKCYIILIDLLID